MYQLKVETDLNLPHQQNNDSLKEWIATKIGAPPHEYWKTKSPSYFWDASQFQLHRSSLFKACTIEEQNEILHHCHDMLMTDFYFLEKSGLAYCAKMILLSETTQASQMFGLIACDEATHLEWFTQYIRPELRTNPQGKLLPVLGKIIEDCDANSLHYLVQTLIEGWGVITYQALSATCQSKDFQILLNHILRDEALHHKTGTALFSAKKINHTTSNFILDKMKAYAEVFRVGPQTVVQCVEKVRGELNLNTLELLFSELKAPQTSKIKLQLLKNLMNQPTMESYVDKLEVAGLFKPYNVAECAKIYQSTRGSKQFL